MRARAIASCPAAPRSAKAGARAATSAADGRYPRSSSSVRPATATRSPTGPAWARARVASAYSSSASRSRPSMVAIASAATPMWIEAGACHSGPPSANRGTRDTDSTPPATIMAASPARTRAAARLTASRPEAQKRLMVAPGTCGLQPACSTAVRARLPPCSPVCEAQPSMTSSTTSGSRPRSTSPSSSASTSSSGGTACSAPRAEPLPRGVRTASAITGSPRVAGALMPGPSRRGCRGRSARAGPGGRPARR